MLTVRPAWMTKHKAALAMAGLAGLALLLFLTVSLAPSRSLAQHGPLGDFQKQGDVGITPRAGTAKYDAARGEYRIWGGGANMWEATDAFHFVWRRLSGDVNLAADVAWPHPGGNAHRKAGWMIRQSLEPNAPYVDVVVHGDGLTALQFRRTTGAATEEVRATISAPARIGLERHGDEFTLWAAAAGKPLEREGSIHLALHDPVYVGLVVCSHDAQRIEEAVFSHVSLKPTAGEEGSNSEPEVESRLEIITVDGQQRHVLYQARGRFEAPNWSRDGKELLFNREGHIYVLPVSGGEPRQLNTGSATHCNNDHGFSPDGKWLAISNSPRDASLIYILPSTGGEPRLVTPVGPSYWHGWSPDGKTLAYCAERHGNFDIYTIPAAGGREKRLTTAQGLDDGPDYSPDGRYIYFNSVRTGHMQIWRMRPDGSDQEQVTHDNYNDWFAHPSPDGKWLVFLTYNAGVEGHPPNHHVMLRIMPAAGGEPRTLAKLFGGQGTINVPSWAPDSRRLAFVSYELLKAKE
jgi:TolB protein